MRSHQIFRRISQFRCPPQPKGKSETVEFTHTSFGYGCTGKYNIPKSEYPGLFDDITDAIETGVPINLTERTNPAKPITIDVDEKYDLEIGKRLHTQQHIVDLVREYAEAIEFYIDIKSEQIKAFVFERTKPYRERGYTRDGIHIMYPDIICDTSLQLLIRQRVLKNFDKLFTDLPLKNEPADILDRSVVDRNNWLMWGCSKPGKEPYSLTHVYSIHIPEDGQKNFIEIEPSTYTGDTRKFVEYLSIHKPHETHNTFGVNPDRKQEHDHHVAEITKRDLRGFRMTKSFVPRARAIATDVDLEEVRALVEILGDYRADEYEHWMRVGWCLHNVHPSLIDAWDKFSQRSPSYKSGEPETLWKDMREDGELGLGCLHAWARIDNYHEYLHVREKSINKALMYSTTCLHHDVASALHQTYRYQFVCTSIKYNSWFEFSNHRWQPIELGITLRNRIGNEFLRMYHRLAGHLNEVASETEEEKISHYSAQVKDLIDVTIKLRDCTFKDKVMRECAGMFYDKSFMQRLDTNPYLIGFENGIYDLKTHKLRDGQPEDMLSLSTANEYREYNDDDENVVELYEFLCQIFPDIDLHEYQMKTLASYLEGCNPQERFWIWLGSGGNGKSKLIELLELTLGDYACKFSPSSLTQKRPPANTPQPELVRSKGRRTATAQELSHNEELNMAIIKEWTGGDKVIARGLYMDPIEFKIVFKLVLCCNHLPKITDDDDGTWRRIRVVPFNSRFVDTPDPRRRTEFKRDMHLSEKLPLWRHAFMHMLISYYKRYQVEGIKEPPIVMSATEEYQRATDVFLSFMNECLEEDENSKLTLVNAYAHFKKWYSSEYDAKAPTRAIFKEKISRKIGNYIDARTGWPGFKIKQEEEAEPTVLPVEKQREIKALIQNARDRTESKVVPHVVPQPVKIKIPQITRVLQIVPTQLKSGLDQATNAVIPSQIVPISLTR